MWKNRPFLALALAGILFLLLEQDSLPLQIALGFAAMLLGARLAVLIIKGIKSGDGTERGYYGRPPSYSLDNRHGGGE